MLFIVILVESPASHWGSLNFQKMVCHTRGPHFSKGVPIFPEIWGSQVPILPGKWGPGSPYSREYRDPGPHFPGSMGTRDPHFGGSPFSHDTGFTMTPENALSAGCVKCSVASFPVLHRSYRRLQYE